MRAVRLTEIGGPLVEVELPAPQPGSGEVVVAVAAAGICHSDIHYRDGFAPIDLPITLGHEVAGVIAAVGDGVDPGRVGGRVAVHYVVSCGRCDGCRRRGEQFCERYGMVGKSRDGGYAESLVIPARNAVDVPEGVDLHHAAVMMCSSATALHALHRAALRPGENVAVFGVGGLGLSAVQLARTMGAGVVFAVDIDTDRLERSRRLGATPVDADSAAAVMAAAAGGIDVALDLVGSTPVLRTALESMAPGGRVVSVGLTDEPLGVRPFGDLIGRELSLLGSNDHLLGEVHELLAMAASGALRLDEVITEVVPLDAGAVNRAMDEVARFGAGGRRVIVPAGA